MRLRRALARVLITSLALAGAVAVSAGSALAEPTTVTVTPATAVNPVGTSHMVTATVLDEDGNPDSGRIVRFFVNGEPGPGASGCISLEPTGQCSYTYQGPELPRTDVITACADTDADGVIEPGEPCGSATKTWASPASTPGHVTGGGQVAPHVTFALTAKSDRKGVKGSCLVVDPSTGTVVVCLDVTSLVQVGNGATLFGNALVDGVRTTYRIDVVDNGEPGRNDVFSIQTGTGYTAGGVLTRGNVQVH
jgi:hypothetical protein